MYIDSAMTTTEIKKELYKQKPTAYLRYIRGSVAYYYAQLNEQQVEFEVPVDDMGTADFLDTMDAKLLCRWLTNSSE